MDRRTFFQVLAAASAALALPRLTSAVPVADPPPPERESAQDIIRQLLRKCVATSYSVSRLVGGGSRIEVRYEYDPDGTRRSLGSRTQSEVDALLGDKAGIASATVESQYVGDIMTLDAGPFWNCPAGDYRHIVIVEWIVA